MSLFKHYKKSNGLDFDPDFFRDQHADKNQELDLPVAETRFLGKHVSDTKLTLVFGIMGLFLVILLGKACYVQLVRGSYYQDLSDTNRIRVTPIIASRGLILDRKGDPLVRNLPIFDARVVPVELPYADQERRQEIDQIAGIIGVTGQQIADALAVYKKTHKYPVTILENIDYEKALLLKIKSADIPALVIDTRNRREYTNSKFSHVLGYEGKINQDELAANPGDEYLYNDRIGKTGLEKSYESTLRGSYGFTETEINVHGEAEKILAKKDAVSGDSIILGIDRAVQEKVDSVLDAQLRTYGKTRASVIMMDPRNGEILALVSRPSYDNNLFSRGISADEYSALANNPDKPLYDRSVKGEYPSGSTVKIVVAGGALQEGVITDRTTVNSTGGIWVYDKWFFPDWKAGGHGLTNVYKAIAWSVNTFFYEVGGGYNDFKGLGHEGLAKYFRLAGLGAPTGIDIPGESSGLVPDEQWKKETTGEQWYIGDTYHMAIGQGHLLVTPLQVAEYTSFFANGGTLYRPHIVHSIKHADGSERVIEPQVVRTGFISEKNVDTVRTGMRQTVTTGSAQSLNSLPVTNAGKTGTAQWASNKATHAWYTGFAPYNNPEVVITVLVEEGGEGSVVSVPIVHDILQWYFTDYKKAKE